MSKFLVDGPKNAPIAILAHGSGAPMDSEFMNEFAAFAGADGVQIVRFEFTYMAGRRTTGKKPPPPKAEKLIDEFDAVLKEVKTQYGDTAIFVGGKSLGGRVASMMAQKHFDAGEISGLVCLGYPFHPPGQPDKLRTSHFVDFNCPNLICQGENDPFGKRDEIENYDLPDSFQFHWAPFGNHDMAPPKRSGLTKQQNWRDVAGTVANFMKG